MIKFLKNISFFSIFFLSIFSILKLTGKNETKNYSSAFVAKLEILQSYKNEKKIVLIGGSSVGWGLSAEQIEKKTGIKTINIGHYAGFGLIDFMPFVLKNITKEDIIILSPEWHIYTNPTYSDKATLNELIINNPRYGQLLGNRMYELRALGGKLNLNMFEHENITTPYRYNCFNKNGDIISHCELPGGTLSYYTINNDSLKIGDFEKYFQFLKSNKTIFLFPPTQEIIYKENLPFLKKIESELISYNYKIVDNIEGNVYADSLFFGAQYHLTCKARLMRTDKLIAYLKKHVL